MKNEKSKFIIIIREKCGKSVKICIGLKKTCLGVLKREERDKENEKGFEIGTEMSTTVLHSRCSLLRFCIYLPLLVST